MSRHFENRNKDLVNEVGPITYFSNTVRISLNRELYN